jgi:hypothetical protein
MTPLLDAMRSGPRHPASESGCAARYDPFPSLIRTVTTSCFGSRMSRAGNHSQIAVALVHRDGPWEHARRVRRAMKPSFAVV